MKLKENMILKSTWTRNKRW